MWEDAGPPVRIGAAVKLPGHLSAVAETRGVPSEGFVYNVSPYMEYHPGGEDELMRAAGSDGTDLFDQVHRWVNYESMLKECLVGRMAMKPALPKGTWIQG
ncbi:CYB5R4 [Cervus elaphus hippelaphus]|uniref:CYB5R4 n=1 Tax=Cervus elaphus hippelaphus TaxID=46360 RepID=A0A212C7K0_CEREH|nr:CYB5R4 [Cervus elaphus hippelaphus]